MLERSGMERLDIVVILIALKLDRRFCGNVVIKNGLAISYQTDLFRYFLDSRKILCDIAHGNIQRKNTKAFN